MDVAFLAPEQQRLLFHSAFLSLPRLALVGSNSSASYNLGLEQYAIQAFAEALEVVPVTLAENAGLKVNFVPLVK
jgi:chaperonin GroEL (HSP60 family)